MVSNWPKISLPASDMHTFKPPGGIALNEQVSFPPELFIQKAIPRKRLVGKNLLTTILLRRGENKSIIGPATPAAVVVFLNNENMLLVEIWATSSWEGDQYLMRFSWNCDKEAATAHCCQRGAIHANVCTNIKTLFELLTNEWEEEGGNLTST